MWRWKIVSGTVLSALVLGLVAAQDAPRFSDFVAGSADAQEVDLTFYLQNISPCFLEEVTLNVAHGASRDSTEEVSFVVQLGPGAVGTYAVALERPVEAGWAWTVDRVALDKARSTRTCTFEDTVTFASQFEPPEADTAPNGADEAAAGADPAAGVAAPDETVETASAPLETYTVQAGDTLWEIAQTFNTLVPLIVAANCLPSDFLQVGQELAVPQMDADLSALGAACN